MVLFYGCLKPKQNLLQGDLRMSKNNSLFSQLLGFFPRLEFQRMVNKHKAEYKTKGFSCWQQFVAMLFFQLGRANSLNEITKGLAASRFRRAIFWLWAIKVVIG
jgi:hypothetical protein